jgi:hypothetical protein
MFGVSLVVSDVFIRKQGYGLYNAIHSAIIRWSLLENLDSTVLYTYAFPSPIYVVFYPGIYVPFSLRASESFTDMCNLVLWKQSNLTSKIW